jgi:hypothetical protein
MLWRIFVIFRQIFCATHTQDGFESILALLHSKGMPLRRDSSHLEAMLPQLVLCINGHRRIVLNDVSSIGREASPLGLEQAFEFIGLAASSI